MTSDLQNLWRGKTDDEVIDAMKDIRGYLPDAQRVIRAEFAERGLTYRKTIREEKKEHREKVTQDATESIKQVLFPTTTRTTIRFVGILCVASIVLSVESAAETVGWVIEYGDAMSTMISAMSVGTLAWATWAAYSAFRPSPRGWTVMVTFLAMSAGAPIARYVTSFGIVNQVIFGLEFSMADQAILGLASAVVWAYALYRLYRPDVLLVMDVADDRRDRTTKRIKWLVVAVIALPIVWRLYLSM
jgi:hypothetical protein